MNLTTLQLTTKGVCEALGCRRKSHRRYCHWYDKLVPRNGTSCEGKNRCAFKRCIDPTKEDENLPDPTTKPSSTPLPTSPPTPGKEEEGEEYLRKNCIFIEKNSQKVYFCGLIENVF